MNKLKTFTGGMPFVMDNFDFLDASLRDTIQGILTSFVPNGQTGMVLSGCAWTRAESGANATYTCESGWVFLNGELRKVPAHTVVGNATQPCFFGEVNTPHADGSLTFHDGTVRNVWEVREASLQIAATVPSIYLALDAQGIERVSEKIGVLHDHLNGEIETLHTHLNGEIETLHTHLNGEITAVSDSVGTLHTHLNGEITALGTQISAIGRIPAGIICLWWGCGNGNGEPIPNGWAACDGVNDMPSLGTVGGYPYILKLVTE